MFDKAVLVAMALALVAPSIHAQQQSRPEPPPDNGAQRRQELLNRQAMSHARTMQLGDHQAWLNSLANKARLRAKLAEAWQRMGLAPQAARMVADAYDPEMASQMHHASLRGKSDEDVAELLQSALSSRRYLVADQLLIDYQRARLSLGEMAASEPHHILGGM